MISLICGDALEEMKKLDGESIDCCITSPKGGTILDPFAGAGTTGVVAKKNNRNFIGVELNPTYVKMAQQRMDNTQESLF